MDDFILKHKAWILLACAVVVIVLLLSVIAEAGEREPFTIDISKTAQFGLGLATSVAIHEGSHWLMLELKDRDYRFHLRHGWHPSFTYEGRTSDLIQMGGLLANVWSSEVILQVEKEKRGPFLNGILVGNMLEQLIYPTIRWGRGDFKPLSGTDRALWGAFFVAHAGLTAVRVYHDGQLNAYTWFGATENGTPMLGLKIQW